MDTTQLQNRIEELNSKYEELETNSRKNIEELTQRLQDLQVLFEQHNHSNSDSTMRLRNGFELPVEEIGYIGNGGLAGFSFNNGVSVGVDTLAIASGKDRGISSSVSQSSTNVSLALQNQVELFFFFSAGKSWTNKSPFNISSGTSILTDTTFNWDTNALAGYHLNIYDSAGALVESHLIASNTPTVVTISGTFNSTTANATYSIFQSTYNGSADNPWRRLYTGDGTDGGVRFGYGTTAGGQTTLLYSDNGTLKYRDTGGTSHTITMV